METLTIKHKGQAITKRITGTIFIVLGTYMLIYNSGSHEITDWVLYILMLIFGINNFTPYSGSDTTRLVPGDNGLKIRWRSWAFWKLIRPDEVEKIILGRPYVLVYRKGKKPLRLDIDYLEKEQKTQVNDFFLEYARQKNLVIEKHGLDE